MNEKLVKALKNQGFEDLKVLADMINTGTIRLVSTELYSIVLTDATCQWLQNKSINSFVKGRSYWALNEMDAFNQFKTEYPLIEDILMVNIAKI